MWLLEERTDSKRNLDLIIDPALIQELISFNMEGNFDRVMGFAGCILGLEELSNLSKRKLMTEEESSSLYKDFDRLIINNKKLFNAKLSKAAPTLF
jgi:hypothetical protein